MDRTPVYDQVGYSRLTTASCVKQNSVYDEYIKYHGFKEWTKLNCEYFMMGNRIKECSLLKTSGIEVNTANVSETMRLIDQLGTDIMFYNSSAAEEEIAKQFPTELWRVLKFSMYTSILHIVVIIPVFRGGTLFQTRIIIIYMCSLLIQRARKS
jgi:hypothetical protein